MLKKILIALFACFCTGAAACEQKEFFPKISHGSIVETFRFMAPELRRVNCYKLFTEMRSCTYMGNNTEVQIQFCEKKVNDVSGIIVRFPNTKGAPDTPVVAILALGLPEPEVEEIRKYIYAFIFNVPLPKQPKSVEIGIRASETFFTMSLDAKKSQQ